MEKNFTWAAMKGDGAGYAIETIWTGFPSEEAVHVFLEELGYKKLAGFNGKVYRKGNYTGFAAVDIK